MVIGIGGVSRAGKTTLARLLAEELEKEDFKVIVLSQDDFAIAEKLIPKIKDRTNWEIPESIDFKKYKKSIVKASKKAQVVIAEGLFAFYDKTVTDLYDKKIFIKIPKKLFVERKETDFRWGSTQEPKWYINHIWKAYKKYGFVEGADDILSLTGTKKFDLPVITDYVLDRTAAYKLFQTIAEELVQNHKYVEQGPMMSAPGIRYKNKNFAFFYKEEMTFKLGKNFNAKANGIKKVRHLSPFKTKPPMKSWYIISSNQKDLWPLLSGLALDYIQREIG